MSAFRPRWLMRGTTIRRPRLRGQWRIDSAAWLPAGSLPCMPPVRKTTGPDSAPSTTYHGVAHAVVLSQNACRRSNRSGSLFRSTGLQTTAQDQQKQNRHQQKQHRQAGSRLTGDTFSDLQGMEVDSHGTVPGNSSSSSQRQKSQTSVYTVFCAAELADSPDSGLICFPLSCFQETRS